MVVGVMLSGPFRSGQNAAQKRDQRRSDDKGRIVNSQHSLSPLHWSPYEFNER